MLARSYGPGGQRKGFGGATRINVPPFFIERLAALELHLLSRRIDRGHGVVHDVDAVLLAQRVVAVRDGLHRAEAADYVIAERAGDELQVRLDQRYRDARVAAAQVLRARRAAEPAADD